MNVSRRDLLLSGACTAGMGIAAPSWARSAQPRFPDSRALRAMLQPSIGALGDSARTERLGQSSGGRPIDLVSIGNGPRSALIVGAPHPNEPIGCLTVVRLIERLARDRNFRERSGYTWHFIPAIDVDGLDLNSGWFNEPLTLASYCRHFFRPAFSAQPEYSFPLAIADYRFDASTPENICWQRAIEIARPHLQSSLHGNDSGGAFYLLSNNIPDLAAALAREPQAKGIALNDLGEPDSDLEHFAPGVFSFFEVEPWLRRAQQGKGVSADFWNAGRSSAEFARERHGTLSVTCEVPLWSDPRLFSTRPSRFSRADVARMQIEQGTQNLRLLDRAASMLEGPSGSDESAALALALREAAATLPGQLRAYEELCASADAKAMVTLPDLVQLEPGTAAMRAPAMLARLARLMARPELASAASTLLEEHIRSFEASTSLQPIATDVTTSLQMQSILTAMALMPRERSLSSPGKKGARLEGRTPASPTIS